MRHKMNRLFTERYSYLYFLGIAIWRLRYLLCSNCIIRSNPCFLSLVWDNTEHLCCICIPYEPAYFTIKTEAGVCGFRGCQLVRCLISRLHVPNPSPLCGAGTQSTSSRMVGPSHRPVQALDLYETKYPASHLRKGPFDRSQLMVVKEMDTSNQTVMNMFLALNTCRCKSCYACCSLSQPILTGGVGPQCRTNGS